MGEPSPEWVMHFLAIFCDNDLNYLYFHTLFYNSYLSNKSIVFNFSVVF